MGKSQYIRHKMNSDWLLMFIITIFGDHNILVIKSAGPVLAQNPDPCLLQNQWRAELKEEVNRDLQVS